MQRKIIGDWALICLEKGETTIGWLTNDRAQDAFTCDPGTDYETAVFDTSRLVVDFSLVNKDWSIYVHRDLLR